MTVYTARDLQNAYMAGDGATLSTGNQAFMGSYGCYGYFSALREFQTQLSRDYGGDISQMALARAEGHFETSVNHLITGRLSA